VYKRKIEFLTKLQYSENITSKPSEKNIIDELALVHGLMSCVV